jgi:hypothetical protein
MSVNEKITQIKSNISEKLELAKTRVATRSIPVNVNNKALTEEYNNTIKRIDAELLNFKNNNSHYALFNSDTLRENKLLSEVKNISNCFLRHIDVLINNRYVEEYESEVLYNKHKENLETLKQRQLDQFANTTMFITSKKVSKQMRDHWY